MPLAKHVVDSVLKFRVNDSRILRLPKFTKDSEDGLVYPQEILKAFIRYFNNLYQARATFAEKFIVDTKPMGENPGQSHLDMLVFVPGELTREDFLDNLEDFSLNYPGIKCELIKRWPKANEWNEEHRAEIEAGKAKPRKEGIMMAKNAASSWPKKKLETLVSYIDETEPVNPYPNLSFEELEALEGKKDPKLKAYYEAMSEYDQHQSDLKGLLTAFEEEFGRKFNKNSEDDRRKLKYIYANQYEQKIQEYREWYPASVRVHIPVGQFAPGQKGNIDLLSLYDSKKIRKKRISDEEFKEKLNVWFRSNPHVFKEHNFSYKTLKIYLERFGVNFSKINSIEELAKVLNENVGYLEHSFKDSIIYLQQFLKMLISEYPESNELKASLEKVNESIKKIIERDTEKIEYFKRKIEFYQRLLND